MVLLTFSIQDWRFCKLLFFLRVLEPVLRSGNLAVASCNPQQQQQQQSILNFWLVSVTCITLLSLDLLFMQYFFL